MANNYLAHHGILGQKWGKRNGPPYPLDNSQKSKKELSKVRSYKGKNKFTRFSDTNESEVRDGSYISSTKHDYHQYKIDASVGNIGNDPGKDLYEITLEAHGNAKIADISVTMTDAMNSIKSKKLKTPKEIKAINTYEKLNQVGYFDSSKSINERYHLMLSVLSPKHSRIGILYRTPTIVKPDEVARLRRNSLARRVHKEVYKDRKGYSEKYKKAGYDAVVDPEDYTFGYDMPYIVTNSNKFRVSSTKKIKKKATLVKHSLGGDSMSYDELVHALFTEEPPKEDHLEHHGILGMKWYHRRFQNEDGSLTPAGRERYGVGEAREGSSDKPKKPGLIERHKQKKEEKHKAAEKAKRVKRMQEGRARKAAEKKEAEEHEAAKQKALRSAKASEIMKYRDELTDQEMKDAVARIGWDEALRKKAKEENPDTLTKAMKVVDKYGKAAGSIATATENTTKMYNNIAKALNTFTGSDWPIVGDGKKDQNGSDNKDNTSKPSKSNDGKKSSKKDKEPSKKDKENFQKTMNEAAKILGEAAKKVDEESKKQAEKEEKHDWTVDDKPASSKTSSSSSNDKGTFDTKFEYSDAKAERAEQIGRDAVDRYLQLEDKRKR